MEITSDNSTNMRYWPVPPQRVDVPYIKHCVFILSPNIIHATATIRYMKVQHYQQAMDIKALQGAEQVLISLVMADKLKINVPGRIRNYYCGQAVMSNVIFLKTLFDFCFMTHRSQATVWGKCFWYNWYTCITSAMAKHGTCLDFKDI